MHPALRLRSLDKLEKAIVDALAKGKTGMSQGDVIAQIGGRASQATVSRAMARLIQSGIIQKSGSTKNASFALTPDAAWFQTPPWLRQTVPYDPGRIRGYVPNVTRWLALEARDRMAAAAAGVNAALDASTYSREIAERFLIDLSWASSSLEGNTYDYLSTEALLRYGQEASGHDRVEATMILNHKHAISTMLESVGQDIFDTRFTGRMHALLMRDLISPEDLGRIRANRVQIKGTSYQPEPDGRVIASDLGSLLWKAGQVEDPFEASFLLLGGISYLQGYVDGNKRTSRLMCSVPLLWRGLPPMSFIGVDKADYLTGLIVNYELGDTSILADTIAAAYEAVAPSYHAAMATQRVPRMVELRERARVERIVQEFVGQAVGGRAPDQAAFVAARLADLPDDDREILDRGIDRILASMTPESAAAWGITAENADAFIQIRDDEVGNGSEPGPAP